MTDLRRALACLREGTEVLRTGGGTSLTASQCNLLLEERESARADFAKIAELMEAALHNPAWPIQACVDVRGIAEARASRS